MNSNGKFEGYEAIGAIRFNDIIIEPGQSKTYIVAMAFGESKRDIESISNDVLKETDFDSLLEETKLYWNNKINISYKTKDSEFDNWMYWVNFQPMLRRIYGCSFLPHHDYGKGGRGWRDLW